MKKKNTNCLAGIRCTCGSLGPFKIAVTAFAVVSDDGTDDFSAVEWDVSSGCACLECGRVGIVSDFTAVKQGTIGLGLKALLRRFKLEDNGKWEKCPSVTGPKKHFWFNPNLQGLKTWIVWDFDLRHYVKRQERGVHESR